MKRLEAGWTVAFAGMAGLTVGAYSMGSLMMPLFLEPMTQEFHWTRAQYFLAPLPSAVLGAIIMPTLGRLADRFGLRVVHLPGVIAYGLVCMLLSTLNGTMTQYIAYMLLFSATAMFQSPPLYAKAVSAWMDRNRGMGLSVAMTGNGLGGIIIPPIAALLLMEYGWRDTRIVLGLMVILVAFPAIFFFIKEPPAPDGKRASAHRHMPGVSVREAIGDPTFWFLVLAFFLVGSATVGILSNIVPLLRDHGFNDAQVLGAELIPVLALGQTGGRFLSGWLLDRFSTPKVGIVLFALAFLGVGVIYLGTAIPMLLVGALCLGLGLGAELEVAAFYAGRFFGLKNFGSLYSLVFGAFIIGNAVGGLFMGWSRDTFGSYNIAVIAAESAFVIACIAVFVLRGYVYKAPGHGEPIARVGDTRQTA